VRCLRSLGRPPSCRKFFPNWFFSLLTLEFIDLFSLVSSSPLVYLWVFPCFHFFSVLLFRFFAIIVSFFSPSLHALLLSVNCYFSLPFSASASYNQCFLYLPLSFAVLKFFYCRWKVRRSFSPAKKFNRALLFRRQHQNCGDALFQGLASFLLSGVAVDVKGFGFSSPVSCCS
jgi:hypothetical protein